MATLFQILQFFDGSGNPLSSGKLYWYQAGTSTPKDTFSDQGAGTPLPNPVILDLEGRISDQSPYERGVWLSGSYKLVIKDSKDVENTTLDNINEYDSLDWTGLTASIADLNSTTANTLLKTNTYAISLADRNKTILCDATTGAFLINLPTSVSVGNTFRIYIKKTDLGNNEITITPNGVETIDGRNSFEIASPFDVIGLQCDGSNWHILTEETRNKTFTITATTNIGLEDYRKTFLSDASGGAIDINLPLTNTVGSGFSITVKKTDSSANAVTLKASGAETIDGASSFVLNNEWDSYEIASVNGTGWFIKDDHVGELSVALPRDYIAGISITQDPGDTAHDISFGIGECRDHASSANMILNSAIVKKIDAPWSPGTNQGGYPSATGPSLTPNTWYHLFVIKSAGGIVDAGFDKKLDAADLLSSSGYTKYRRVGSVRTNVSSNITDFFMRNFEGFRDYYWKTPVTDLNAALPTGVNNATATLTVPVDIEVIAKFNMTAKNGGSITARFHYISQDALVGGSNGFAQLFAPSGAEDVSNIQVRTNVSAQIGYVTDVLISGTLIAGTEGWIDNLSTL